MFKQLRVKIVDELVNRYKDVKNFLLVDYKGLKANQAVELRRELSQSNIRINAVKNSVLEHAFNQLGISEVKKYLTGMNALVYGKDPIALTKKVFSYKDKNKVLDIRCGYVEGKFISFEDAKKLSLLLSREQLLSQMMGTLTIPMANLVRGLNGIIQKLVYTVNAIKGKKEKE